MLGKDDALGRLADGVPGTTDTLQAAGDTARRLHLDDEVDGSHVDPQLQARGRYQRRQTAGLEGLLDLGALLPGDRAMVGPNQLWRRAGRWVVPRFLRRQLIEARGQPLRHPPRVDEDDGRAMLADQLQEPWMNGRPDAPPRHSRLSLRDHGCALPGASLEVGHVLHRHLDRYLQRLSHAGVDDLHVPAHAAKEARHHLEGTLGRGQADALRLGFGQSPQPLEAQGQVGAALGGGHRVDLVDDHPAHRVEQLAGGTGEHQE